MAAAKERRVIEEDLANVEFETSEDVEVRDLLKPPKFLSETFRLEIELNSF